ncbi:MAG: hypothetical protein KGQ36_04220 [Rickettsiales bacterium]|nr:hypothetical protein [Rickettsiales bacterium]
MLNDVIKEIASQYIISTDGLIKNDVICSLSLEEKTIIKNAFDLKESYASHIDCFGEDCYEEVEIKKGDDGKKYIQCPECKIFEWIVEGQDIAYKVTLSGFSDFLIELLNIEKNKVVIKSDEAIYLGKNVLEDLGSLEVNYVIVRGIEAENIVIKRHRDTDLKSITVIINIDSNNKSAKESRLARCYFCDLISYDENNNELLLNYRVFADSIKGCFGGINNTIIRKWLNNRCIEWFKKLVKNKKIDRGEKDKFRYLAIDYFGIKNNQFEKIWSKYAPKKLKRKGRISL